MFHHDALPKVIRLFQVLDGRSSEIDVSNAFIQRCDQIKQLAHRCLPQLVISLLNWRNSALEKCLQYMIESFQLTSLEVCKKKEKLQCAVDQVWALALYSVLSSFDGSNLEENTCKQIEDICFAHVCQHTECQVQPFGQVLGILSSYRMLGIASRLTAAVRALPPAAQSLGVRTVSALGFLRLSHSSPNLRRTSTQYLRLCLELTRRASCKCLGPDLKHAVCAALVSSLADVQPAHSQIADVGRTPRDMDAEAWTSVLELARNRAIDWASRPKHRSAAYPLLAVLAVSVDGDAEADARVGAFLRDIVADGGLLNPPRAVTAVAAAAGLTRSVDLRSAGARSVRILVNALRRRSSVSTAESRRILATLVCSRAPALVSASDLPEPAAVAIAETLAIGARHLDYVQIITAVESGGASCPTPISAECGERHWHNCILRLLRAEDERQVSCGELSISAQHIW